MPGYPDSHLNPAPGRGPSPRMQAVFVAIPVILAAAWLIYFWSITGVHTVIEKYPNGQVRAEGYARRSGVENYKRHGHWVTYHENGKKESEGFYERGEKTGAWSYWDSNGQSIPAPTTTKPGNP